MGPRADSLDVVAAALPTLPERLKELDLPLTELREKHLELAVKDAVEADPAAGTVANRVIPIEGWSSLGRGGFDFVLSTDPGGPPLHVAELKWCQLGEDKVYEVLWDLFKVGLALDSVETITRGTLITAAPAAMWTRTFCRDIFEGGTFSTADLALRPYPRSRSGRPAWDYLLEGGHDRAPDWLPASVTTSPTTIVTLSDAQTTWEIRAIDVMPVPDAGSVRFLDGWPNGMRPASARHPLG